LKRILFVDDESRILSGIRRMLHGRRNEWELVFVDDPLVAAEMLGEGRFDVVVSDMRMPKMNGAELLAVAQQKAPAATRIMLSGQCDRENTLQSVPVAHQFLSKPCSADALIGAIASAIETTSLLDAEAVRSIAGAPSSLPSPPQVYQRLVQAASSDDSDIEDVVAILRTDTALCAKTLQIVNSSFFGLGAKTSEVRQAVSYLGLKTIRQVVLGAEVFRSFDRTKLSPHVDLELAHVHALAVAELASRVVSNPADAESAYTAGILHDLGELVLGLQPANPELVLDDNCRGAWTAPEPSPFPLHATAGAYLAGQWGLPRVIVDAIAQHHKLSRTMNPRATVSDAVAIADALCIAVSDASEASRSRVLQRVRECYLDPLQLLGREQELLEEAERRLAGENQGDEAPKA